MRRLKSLAVGAALAVSLGGCASDPAFWDSVSQGLDTLAYELDNRPVCTWTERYGQVCQPAYTTYPQPIEALPTSYYTRRPQDNRGRGDRRGGSHDDGRHGRGKG